MRLPISLSIIALAVGGCSPTGERDRDTIDTPPVVTATPGAVAPADAAKAVTAPPTGEPTAVASTMPEALHGQWRKDDLDRQPTREDCNQTSQSNINFGKVLTVNATGYSLFEDGGRIIDVHGRTANRIEATFDTTYADTPTRARKAFVLRPNGSLVVDSDEGNGQPAPTAYLRCR